MTSPPDLGPTEAIAEEHIGTVEGFGGSQEGISTRQGQEQEGIRGPEKRRHADDVTGRMTTQTRLGAGAMAAVGGPRLGDHIGPKQVDRGHQDEDTGYQDRNTEKRD